MKVERAAFTWYLLTDTLQKKCSKNFAKFLGYHFRRNHCFVMLTAKGTIATIFRTSQGDYLWDHKKLQSI